MAAVEASRIAELAQADSLLLGDHLTVKLQHRVVVVDLVRDVLIGVGVLPVPPQQREPLFLVHPHSMAYAHETR